MCPSFCAYCNGGSAAVKLAAIICGMIDPSGVCRRRLSRPRTPRGDFATRAYGRRADVQGRGEMGQMRPRRDSPRRRAFVENQRKGQYGGTGSTTGVRGYGVNS
jgi:hypothetical protein